MFEIYTGFDFYIHIYIRYCFANLLNAMVLPGCPFVPELMFRGAPDVFHHL
jgi:hypothetical protein